MKLILLLVVSTAALFGEECYQYVEKTPKAFVFDSDNCNGMVNYSIELGSVIRIFARPETNAIGSTPILVVSHTRANSQVEYYSVALGQPGLTRILNIDAPEGYFLDQGIYYVGVAGTPSQVVTLGVCFQRGCVVGDLKSIVYTAEPDFTNHDEGDHEYSTEHEVLEFFLTLAAGLLLILIALYIFVSVSRKMQRERLQAQFPHDT